ncbi:hypothetical protein IJZ97_03760 [bacterium]|nr:hypothetical protein [bacterium]
MNFAHLFSDIPIQIVLVLFIGSIIFCVKKYSYVNKNLKIFIEFLEKFKKSDLTFRFKEIDEGMSANPYVASFWQEFKNTLVFSESVALQGQTEEDVTYQDVSSTIHNIQTTVDPSYFFNDETLVLSKYNAGLMGAVPTILTGCGPLFTFLNIATAFGKIDFSTQERTIASVGGLMSSMQVAAMVSVFAVAACLIFTVMEKILFGVMCQKPAHKAIDLMGKLFDNISSEKFLFELLRETKIQNNSVSNLVSTMPNQFKMAMNTGIASNLVPYLENLIFGINQMNKQLKETAKSSGDSVDDLF